MSYIALFYITLYSTIRGDWPKCAQFIIALAITYSNILMYRLAAWKQLMLIYEADRCKFYLCCFDDANCECNKLM